MSGILVDIRYGDIRWKSKRCLLELWAFLKKMSGKAISLIPYGEGNKR